MKAEEKFEKLGYYKIQDDEDWIYYEKYFGCVAENKIIFDKEKHSIQFGGVRRNWWVVDSKLIDAISEQMKELGWNDETN